MKKSYLLFLIIISVFMMSCGGHFFNPMYYYNRSANKSSSETSIPDTAPEKLPDEVPAENDPFKIPEEYNDPNYQFPADNFKSWLFKASFQKNKLPIYNFFNDNTRNWISGGADWNSIAADYYEGKDGETYAGSIVGNVDITDLKVYRYTANNPLYSSLGYLAGRMDRFNFYSIHGNASVAELKQYLIAVDTYSKFIFAFGAITATKSIAGDEVPIAFEAVEKYGDKAFYEYDPIGYVTASGSVILYDHYKTEFVNAPTKYMPSDHGYPTMAQPTPTGQGYSPYRPLSSSSTEPASEEDQKTFKDNINIIKSNNSSGFKYRNYSGYMVDSKNQLDLDLWKSGNYGGLSLKLYTYTFENGTGTDVNVPDIKVVVETYNNDSAREEKTYKVKTITSKYKAIYENITDPNETVTVSLIKVNNKDSISFNGTSLDPDFIDYGPIFTDRVAGLTFTNSESKYYFFLAQTIYDVKYEFSADGSEFTLSYMVYNLFTADHKETYKYRLARFDDSLSQQFTAIYEVPEESGDDRYGRVNVYSENGKTDNRVNTSQVLFYIGALGTADTEIGLGLDAYRE
ncbi:hypothetical protein BFL38_10845 [Brachyspira hampsonii]|uniref:Uncharacterized protein n=1 Tax=Brachyspira hampsonii TaxID=1287055 RepID=A0A1E5NIP0_9SPIR|nr:hypothetical protein [Brachyspira hampsonii]OEJ15947.1 hypothetical protein BFL38_10845 [Brachyspira hampsonii]